MKNYIMILFFMLLLSSCSNSIREEYYDNGTLKMKYSVNEKGLKEGLVTQYYSNGEIKWIANYTNDTLDGIYKKFHLNGNLSILTSFKKGVQDGKLTEYFSDGKLLQNSDYILGKKNGYIIFYYHNGSKKSVSYVKEDLTQYKIEYDSLNQIRNANHLIKILYLKKLDKTDTIKIKAKIMGLHKIETPVFISMEKYGYIKEGEVPKMTFNLNDSCYYHAFRPQNDTGKFKITISFLAYDRFEQRIDTVFILK